MLALCCCVFSVYAAEVKTDEAKTNTASHAEQQEIEGKKHRRWYVRFEGLNIYPELEDEKLLQGPVNTAFRVLTPKHEGFKTFSQQRDRAKLWAPQVGIGRDLGGRLSLFAEVGYSSGVLRTNQRHATRLLFPMRSSLEMRRGGTYVVLGADYYPFGFPDQRRYQGLVERLREIRPLAGIRVSYNRTVFDANMNLGDAPLNRFLHVRMEKAWDIFNFYPTLGAEMPVSRDTTISLAATYNYPSQQKENLRGPGVSIALKRYFR